MMKKVTQAVIYLAVSKSADCLHDMPHHMTCISNSGKREPLIILDHMSCKLPCLRDIRPPWLHSVQTKACHPSPSANHWEDSVNITAENKDTEICRGEAVGSTQGI